MQIDCDESVAPILIIKDMFPKKINEVILKEAFYNEHRFQQGRIGSKKKESSIINLKYRNNVVAYYDDIYGKNRSRSALNNAIQAHIFENTDFRFLLHSWVYPFHNLWLTTKYTTVVNRYGNEGQHYDWHIDAKASHERWFTMVYFFFHNPKKFSGGEIQFTNSPIYKRKPVIKNAKILTVTPENNMMIIFSANTPHTVLETKSPEKFEDGRFSANLFVGKPD